MPGVKVKETVTISADPATVYPSVADFHHWTPWSPWLIMEPKARVEVAPDGKSYSWEGERVGSGNMQVTAEEPERWVDYDLNFIKPFKSSARVRFELAPAANGSTEVSWHMDTSLPFFLFFMAKSMRAMIGNDYRRGLRLLKDYVEQGDIQSRLEIVGEQDYPGCSYVGLQNDARFSTMASAMEADFSRFWEAIEAASIQASGMPLSLYHRFKPAADRVSYTIAVPADADAVAAPLTRGSLPAGKVFCVRHTGPYRHIGNAWALAQNLIQSKRFKPASKQAPFEVYVNDPKTTPEQALITEVCFPI